MVRSTAALVPSAVLAGCWSLHGPLTEADPIHCDSVVLRDALGVLDPCDRAACEACVDTCGAACTLGSLEYVCGAHRRFTAEEECPGWEFPCEVTSTVITTEEVSPLGYSPAEALAWIAGPFDAEADWWAEPARDPTGVGVSTTAAGPATWVDRTALASYGPSGVMSVAAACQDELLLPVDVSFTTEDGAFDERFPFDASLPWELWGDVELRASLDWQDLGGTFTFDEVDPTAFDDVALEVVAHVGDYFAGRVDVTTRIGSDATDEWLLHWGALTDPGDSR